ncbi:NADPH-dependent FMN reductase [Salinicoccus halodurans]|uniref:FMN-dependent NADPH-azoreductase n=1 Tax=Salinicoccus halodurans TaxID=407035 RepID=A0A0F7HPM4_9STAP|nr:NAD(P)H-dependent oxidoreductase [Salinicoccus halodurans]AKG75154.1 reductase [Salinicoccus halodurans]SFK66565.1 NAD(P)H-dependent FMN reductase [Salinicoccus halodurans]
MVKIGIVTGSTRKARVNMQVAEWVKDFADKLDLDAEFEIVDIKEYDFPMFNEDLPPAMANKQYSTDAINAWSRKIDELDGYIFITPEYNKSVTASLKNAIDYIGPEWGNKSAGIVGYGSTLAVAATLSLRQILGNLNVATVAPFGAFSLFTDFENMSTFKPAEIHDATIENVVNTTVNWAKGLKTIR